MDDQKGLAPIDPMRNWFDMMLARGNNIELMRNFCLTTLTIVGKTVKEYKEHCISLGYGTRATMDKIFSEE